MVSLCALWIKITYLLHQFAWNLYSRRINDGLQDMQGSALWASEFFLKTVLVVNRLGTTSNIRPITYLVVDTA